jgi:hypothetical protein
MTRAATIPVIETDTELRRMYRTVLLFGEFFVGDVAVRV